MHAQLLSQADGEQTEKIILQTLPRLSIKNLQDTSAEVITECQWVNGGWRLIIIISRGAKYAIFFGLHAWIYITCLKLNVFRESLLERITRNQ